MSPLGTAGLCCVFLGLLDAGGQADPAADALTLRDGKVLLGVQIETPARGQVDVIVRRAWARRVVPEWADRWERAEAPTTRRAAARRAERLEAWLRERSTRKVVAGDPINSWIEAELNRLRAGPGASQPSLLMLARCNRGDVKTSRRAEAGRTRLLRQAWLAGLPEPEGMRFRDLKEALEGRGFDVNDSAPVNVDSLLPIPVEIDAAWAIRRGATEVAYDSDLRFVRYGSLVFPEPAAGQPLGLGGGMLAVSALGDLLRENPVDPLAKVLREVAGRGKSGALVTGTVVAEDFSVVNVEIALWVRQGADQWVAAGSRTSRIRPADMDPESGKNLVQDPQVAMVFQAVEALGLGGISPEIKQRTLGVGAAVQKALGIARTAAEADLAALALPVLEPARKPSPEKAPR